MPSNGPARSGMRAGMVAMSDKGTLVITGGSGGIWLATAAQFAADE